MAKASDKNKWIAKLLGRYARNLLLAKYDPEKYETLTVKPTCVCGDRRRTSTVCKALSEEDLIKPLPVWDKSAEFEVKHKTFLKLAPEYAEAPTFKTDGWKESKKYSFSSKEFKPLENRYEHYRRLDGHALDTKNYIYIYLHQDEYVFVERERKVTNRAHYSYSPSTDRIVKEIRIYPRAACSGLEKNVFEAKLELAMKNHPTKVFSLVLEDEFRGIHGDGLIADDTSAFKENTPWTLENFHKRAGKTRKLIEHYQQTLTELKKLEDFAQPLGDEKFMEKCKNVFRTHVIKMAPVYINREDEEDLKELAQLILKGSHEGVIEEENLIKEAACA